MSTSGTFPLVLNISLVIKSLNKANHGLQGTHPPPKNTPGGAEPDRQGYASVAQTDKISRVLLSL